MSGRNTHLGSGNESRLQEMLPQHGRDRDLGTTFGCSPTINKGFLPCSTYSNRTAASARNFLSNSQRKNTSKLQGRGVRRKEQSEAAYTDIDMQIYGNCSKKTPSSDHRPYCSFLGYVIGNYVNQTLGKTVPLKGSNAFHSHACSSPFALIL